MQTAPPDSTICRASGTFSCGWMCINPPPSTATVSPPHSTAVRCATVSTPNASPEITEYPAATASEVIDRVIRSP